MVTNFKLFCDGATNKLQVKELLLTANLKLLIFLENVNKTILQNARTQIIGGKYICDMLHLNINIVY